MLHRLVPRQSNAPFSVPPVAFICALIGAPLVVAFFGFFILLVQVFALYFGGPFYLIFAGPTFYWYLKRRVPNMLEITLLALALNTCVFVLLLVLASLKSNIFNVTDILVLMAVLAVSCPLFGAQHFARSIALSAKRKLTQTSLHFSKKLPPEASAYFKNMLIKRGLCPHNTLSTQGGVSFFAIASTSAAKCTKGNVYSNALTWEIS